MGWGAGILKIFTFPKTYFLYNNVKFWKFYTGENILILKYINIDRCPIPTLLKWACSNVTSTQPLLYRLKSSYVAETFVSELSEIKLEKKFSVNERLYWFIIRNKESTVDNIFRERNMFLPVRIYDAYALGFS